MHCIFTEVRMFSLWVGRSRFLAHDGRGRAQAPRTAPRCVHAPSYIRTNLVSAPAICYDPLTTLVRSPCPSPGSTNSNAPSQMASDSSAYPPLSHVLSTAAHRRPTNMSPAQAIAEAWQRESEDSKKRWKAKDARVKDHYYAPHPWSSVGRNKPQVGSKM